MQIISQSRSREILVLSIHVRGWPRLNDRIHILFINAVLQRSSKFMHQSGSHMSTQAARSALHCNPLRVFSKNSSAFLSLVPLQTITAFRSRGSSRTVSISVQPPGRARRPFAQRHRNLMARTPLCRQAKLPAIPRTDTLSPASPTTSAKRLCRATSWPAVVRLVLIQPTPDRAGDRAISTLVWYSDHGRSCTAHS